MIVERKQYGCVQVLLVQIGLALYLIVIFLGNSQFDEIKPQVLRVQKVAEAGQQISLDRLLPASTNQSQIFTGSLALTAPSNTFSNEEILSLVTSQSLALLPVSYASVSYTKLAYTSISPKADALKTKVFDIYTIGSKPRAPSTVA